MPRDSSFPVLFAYLPYWQPDNPVSNGLSSLVSVSPSVSPSPQNWAKRAKNGVILLTSPKT
jgi:hypothetical protein